jgi:hypothetical protein
MGVMNQMKPLHEMQGLVFQDDGTPPHRARETKALNAVCVKSISSGSIHPSIFEASSAQFFRVIEILTSIPRNSRRVEKRNGKL